MVDFILKTQWLRHVLFWTALFGAFVLFSWDEEQSALITIGSEFINLASYAAVVYVNLFMLIPQFLSRKKLLAYSGSLLLFLVLLTPIIALAYHILYGIGGVSDVNVVDEQEIIFASLLFVAIISTVFQILSEWFKHERERRILEQQKAQSELRFLKSQINPHFLFNTLNNLYALTLKKSDKAPDIVLKLSDMMRYMLYECNEKRVPLEKEIRYIRNYLELERLRQGDQVDIDLSVSGEVKDQQVAPLLFIPFIENCFKHGVNRQLDNSFVHLKMDVNDSEVNMSLVNSKPDNRLGVNHDMAGGIGQVNVRKQLDLLYPNAYKLNINESPFDYNVQLNIKLQN